MFIIKILKQPFIVKKTTYLNSQQRNYIIDQCLDWYEDWHATDPVLYPEKRETLKKEMDFLNNSDLIKHVNEYYCGDEDIFQILNY